MHKDITAGGKLGFWTPRSSLFCLEMTRKTRRVIFFFFFFNMSSYFCRKLSGSKVRRLFPRILHCHPSGRHQEVGKTPSERRQDPGGRRRRQPDLHRLHHVHRPGLDHQEALPRHRNRLGPEDHPHRRPPPLRRPQQHGRWRDVCGVRQPGPPRAESDRVRPGEGSPRTRDRETDLHTGARGLLRAGHHAGERGGGRDPRVLLRGDRRPRPGALGPGARQARPLGVFAALQLPAWRRRTEGRGALVLPAPLSSRNVALRQPLHPSARDVSIPELKPRPQNETFKKCRTHELFSRLKSK